MTPITARSPIQTCARRTAAISSARDVDEIYAAAPDALRQRRLAPNRPGGPACRRQQVNALTTVGSSFECFAVRPDISPQCRLRPQALAYEPLDIRRMTI